MTTRAIHLLTRASGVSRDRLDRILVIGLPIIGGMVSQSVINLIDALLVGRISGTALAAVGIGSYASFIIVSMMMGLSAAVQAIVSRHFGAKRYQQMTEPMLAGLFLTIVVGIPFTLLFIGISPSYLGLFNRDQAVLDIAIPYFDWRTAALAFVGMGFVFRGFWSGIGESKIYLKILLFMHATNAIVSYFLMFGLSEFLGPNTWQGLGTVGSGIGTAIATTLAAVVFFGVTFFHHTERFSLSLPTKSTLLQLSRLALPNSIQQTLFALGTGCLFLIIGMIGTKEQAIGHILTQLQLLLILPAVGLGIAGASLVGQALGQEHKENAYRWGIDVARVAIIILGLLGLPMWIAPEWVLRIFTADKELIALGTWPLRIIGLNIVLEVAAITLTQALLGAGASRKVLKINLLMQWGVFLPLAYLIGPVLGYGLTGIWLLQALQRITLSAIYGFIWRARHWAHISV